VGTRGKGGGRSGGRRRAAPGGARTGARGSARATARTTARGGPWLAAAAAFLVLIGIGGYLMLQGGGAKPPTASTSQDAASGSPQAAPSASASSCTSEPADTTFPASGPKAAPIDVRVTVLNGSGTFGQAEAVLSWMQNTRKYLRTSNGGPAGHVGATTLVYAPNHVDQARTLVAALGLPASALHGDGTAKGLRDPMVLTLGADFQGVGKPFSHC
jgi:hypothetical protein